MTFQANKNIRTNNKGVAAIEFAIVLPLLLFLVISVVEISRYILTNQKIDKVSAQMADIISQTQEPTSLDANGAALTKTFEELLGYKPDSEDGFVFSLIQRPPVAGGVAEPQRITYQSAMNNTASELGSVGTPVPAADLGGLTLNPNDSVIAVETRVTHNNLFGDFLSSFKFGGGGVPDFDGRKLYKPSFYVYRNPLLLNPLGPIAIQDVGPIPAVCGYYRGVEDNNPDFGQNKDFGKRDYDLWPLSTADMPHPCKCYIDPENPDNTNGDMKNKLRTCVPALLDPEYSCPKRNNCCANADAKTKLCYGCYDEEDKKVPATDPNNLVCQPPPPPPCQGCQCNNSCPPPPPPPPPPPCQGCKCNNSCAPTPKPVFGS